MVRNSRRQTVRRSFRSYHNIQHARLNPVTICYSCLLTGWHYCLRAKGISTSCPVHLGSACVRYRGILMKRGPTCLLSSGRSAITVLLGANRCNTQFLIKCGLMFMCIDTPREVIVLSDEEAFLTSWSSNGLQSLPAAAWCGDLYLFPGCPWLTSQWLKWDLIVP